MDESLNKKTKITCSTRAQVLYIPTLPDSTIVPGVGKCLAEIYLGQEGSGQKHLLLPSQMSPGE